MCVCAHLRLSAVMFWSVDTSSVHRFDWMAFSSLVPNVWPSKLRYLSITSLLYKTTKQVYTRHLIIYTQNLKHSGHTNRLQKTKLKVHTHTFSPSHSPFLWSIRAVMVSILVILQVLISSTVAWRETAARTVSTLSSRPSGYAWQTHYSYTTKCGSSPITQHHVTITWFSLLRMILWKSLSSTLSAMAARLFLTSVKSRHASNWAAV